MIEYKMRGGGALFHLQKERGFTLLELLTVLVIIGVFAAIAIVVINYGFLSGLKVYTTSHQIAADMRFAQRLSITNYKNYVLRFTPPPPSQYRSYRVYSWDDPGKTIKEEKIPPNLNCTGEESFTFLVNGSVYFPGVGTVSIDDNKVRRYITVTLSTGKVRISEESGL